MHCVQVSGLPSPAQRLTPVRVRHPAKPQHKQVYVEPLLCCVCSAAQPDEMVKLSGHVVAYPQVGPAALLTAFPVHPDSIPDCLQV